MRRTNIIFRDVDRVERVFLTSAMNSAGDTPLHSLAAAVASAVGGDATIAMLTVASWFAANGCPVNQTNRAGKLPSQLATEAGNSALATFLTKKSSSSSLVSSRTRNPHLVSPPMFHGYTYLSTHINLHTSTSAAFGSLHYPLVSVSVFNAKRVLVEAAQDLVLPVFSATNSFFWGSSWHMQTVTVI